MNIVLLHQMKLSFEELQSTAATSNVDTTILVEPQSPWCTWRVSCGSNAWSGGAQWDITNAQVSKQDFLITLHSNIQIYCWYLSTRAALRNSHVIPSWLKQAERINQFSSHYRNPPPLESKKTWGWMFSSREIKLEYQHSYKGRSKRAKNQQIYLPASEDALLSKNGSCSFLPPLPLAAFQTFKSFCSKWNLELCTCC